MERVGRFVNRILRAKMRARDGEKIDPVELEAAAAHMRPETMRETLERYVRARVSQVAQAKGFGSFDDEDDFVIEEVGPVSPHEDWARIAAAKARNASNPAPSSEPPAGVPPPEPPTA